MNRPPRRPESSILGEGLWIHAIWVGLLMAAVTLAVQAFAIDQGWPWQTMVFTILALLQLAHALAVRSERESTLRLGLGTNKPLLLVVVGTALVQLALVYVPFLRPIFETQVLTIEQLAVVLALAPVPFVAVEIEKWVVRRRDRRRSTARLVVSPR